MLNKMKNIKKTAFSNRDFYYRHSESASYEFEELKIAESFNPISKNSLHLIKLIKSYNGQLEVLNEQLRLKEETIKEKNTDLLRAQREINTIKEASEQKLKKPAESSIEMPQPGETTRSNISVDKHSRNLPDNKKNLKENELWINKKVLENEVKLLNSKINNLKAEKTNNLDEIKQLKQNLAQTKTEKQIIVGEKDKIISSFEAEINNLKEKERKNKRNLICKKAKLQNKKNKSNSLKEKMKMLKDREAKLTKTILVLEHKVEELSNQLLANKQESHYQEKIKELQDSNANLMTQLIDIKTKQSLTSRDSRESSIVSRTQRENMLQIKRMLASVYKKYLTEVRYDQFYYLFTPSQFASIEKEINDLISLVYEKADGSNSLDEEESSIPTTGRSTLVSNQNSFSKP